MVRRLRIGVTNTGEDSMRVEDAEAICREWGKRGVEGQEFEVEWEDNSPERKTAIDSIDYSHTQHRLMGHLSKSVLVLATGEDYQRTAGSLAARFALHCFPSLTRNQRQQC
jgi:hypothetical protein